MRTHAGPTRIEPAMARRSWVLIGVLLWGAAGCSSGPSAPKAACTVDANLFPSPPPLAPASGNVTAGAALQATICPGAAAVELVRESISSPSSPLHLEIIDQSGPPPNSGFAVAVPANATRAGLAGVIGIATAAPGTYRESDVGTCGSVVVCAELPIPSAVVDACQAAKQPCPAGCEVPANFPGAPGCVASLIERCFNAAASAACPGLMTKPPGGSWTLTLTSVAPFALVDGGTVAGTFEVHGTFSATLVGTGENGADGSGTLSLSF